MQQKSHRY